MALGSVVQAGFGIAGAALVACLIQVLIIPMSGIPPLGADGGLWGQASAFLSAHTSYDPARDTILNKSMMSSLLGYWSIGMFTTLLDMFPGTMKAYKIQESKYQGERGAPSPFPTFSEWFDAVRVSMANLMVTSWIITIPLWHLWRSGIGGSRVPKQEADEWVWTAELLNLAVCGLVVDTWFYWTHRALHVTRPINLYAMIHKFHHRFKAPAAVASMYANPIEFAVGNLAGVALGPVLTNCHPYTAYFWFCYALFTTGGSHSGYHMFAAKSHDAHHEFFNYHFGVGGFWDGLCGTEYEGSALHKRNLAKEKAGKAQ